MKKTSVKLDNSNALNPMYEIACSQLIELKRLLSEFHGYGLMIGRGKGHTNGGYKDEEWFTMDIDRDCLPNAIGHSANVKHLKYYPDNRFKNIFFEHISSSALQNADAVHEYYRMSKHEGLLTYFGNNLIAEELSTTFSEQVKNTIKKNLEKAGFTEILMKVRNTYIRSNSTSEYVPSRLRFMYIHAVAMKKH